MSTLGVAIISAYTMLGLVIVAAVAYLLRKLRWWRWLLLGPMLLALAAAAVAPFVEESRIARQYEEACKDAGVHISRQVAADGFYDSTMRSGYENIRRGFKWMEHPAATGRGVEHLERVNGEWQRRIIDRPTARYHFLESEAHRRVFHKVWKSEYIILDSETGEVIARDTSYSRIANTIDQMWLGRIASTLRLCPAAAARSAVPLPARTFVRGKS